MFYEAGHKIGENNLTELEIELENQKSVILVIIKVNEHNYSYLLDNINSHFSFGMAVLKGKRSSSINKEQFLAKVLESRLNSTKLVKINLLKIVSRLLNKNKLLFRLKSTANDSQQLVVYSKKE